MHETAHDEFTSHWKKCMKLLIISLLMHETAHYKFTSHWKKCMKLLMMSLLLSGRNA